MLLTDVTSVKYIRQCIMEGFCWLVYRSFMLLHGRR